jgi:peptidoglycan/LPS O-acetylase OafA/YrhL
LRIFPLYYGYLLLAFALVLLLINFNRQLLSYGTWADAYFAVKHNFAYYLTYTYNFAINLAYFTHTPDTSGRFFGHLWSLSVEEQFYIIFPLIVYFSSAKILKTITLFVLIFCPLLRLWGILYGVNLVTDHFYFGEIFYSNTLCQADALFTGAALAIFTIKISKPYRTFFVTFGIWLLTGIACFVFLRKSGYFLVSAKSLGYDFPAFWFTENTRYWFINIRPVYQYTLVNLLAAAMILPAINGKTLFPKVVQSKPVRYFGQISYGIYIFHLPLVALFILIADKYIGGWANLTAQPASEIMCFIIYLCAVVCLAHLSYKYFERPIVQKYRPGINHKLA